MTDQPKHPAVIVTTSNAYAHLLPVFFYLYTKYWNEPFVLLGYDIPTCELPDTCTFVSMGKQGSVNEWSTDIRRYMEATAPDFFVFLMEDTLLRAPVDDTMAWALCMPEVGRINLTNDVSKRPHTNDGMGVLYAAHDSRYRLSTQPSIWNKRYLLQYMLPNLTPWQMETQDPINDGWEILSLVDYPVKSNEGVNKRDIYKLDLNGMCEEDLQHIKNIAPWHAGK